MKHKVIIAGGRDFCNWRTQDGSPDTKRNSQTRAKAFARIDYLLIHIDYTDIEIVSGGAVGADKVGEEWAIKEGYQPKVFNADWNKHGRAAGILRNIEMGNYATHLIAFWDGKSKGTKHMIDYAKKKGLKVRIIRYERLVYE